MMNIVPLLIDWNGPWLPLSLATALLLGVLLDSPRDARRPLWLRLATRAGAFGVLTWLLQLAIGSPIRPSPLLTASAHIWAVVVEIGWWALGARAAVGALRLVVVLEGRPRETQIISDLLAGAIYIASGLAVVNFVFGVPIAGLIATSGVIAIVLGLALQSTLSDVFSGIAMGLEHAYKPGDMLWVEGGIEGQVIQISWRSTQIATLHTSVAVVPNSVIAKSRLENRSAPTPMRSITVNVGVEASADPRRCIAALTSAALASRIPLASPQPVVTCADLQGDGNQDQVRFTVGLSKDIEPARSEVLSLIHRHLRHAGIGLGIEGVAPGPRASCPTLADLMAESDLFGQLTEDERDLLGDHVVIETYDVGKMLVCQNDMPNAVFLIAGGTVELTRVAADRTRVLMRPSPGDSICAMALIAGMPSLFTAVALTPVLTYVLKVEAIAAALRSRPDLAASLETQAKRGSAWIRCETEAHDDVTDERSDMLLSRLRQFLRRLNV
jgi:small-conductance mechanosensitive channel/CRP-like cAMP-binding protein